MSSCELTMDNSRYQEWLKCAKYNPSASIKISLASGFTSEGIIAIVVGFLIGAGLFGGFSAFGYCGTHTGVYPDGTPYDVTARDLLLGHTFVALSGTTLVAGVIILLIAKKSRKDIENDKDNAILKTYQSSQLEKWSVNGNPAVKSKLEDSKKITALIPLPFAFLFLIPTFLFIFGSHTGINHCGSTPQPYDHTSSDMAAAIGFGTVGSIPLAISLLLLGQAIKNRREIESDTKDVLLNRLLQPTTTEMTKPQNA